MTVSIRPATASDLAAVEAIIAAAYTPYIARIGQRPGPMDDNYAKRITEGQMHVLELEGAVMACLVLIRESNSMLLDNIAVAQAARGMGYGRILLNFAEAEALAHGYGEIRLYTHVTMTENIALYARLGYAETHRAVEHGLHRVFMRKGLVASE